MENTTQNSSSSAPKYSVFVLEDDPNILQMMMDALETAGYVVLAATNGQAMLDLLDTAPLPNILLLDLLMPDMDGQAFLKKAYQRVGRNAFPPVLIVSGAHNIEMLAGQMQAQDYLVKPFTMQSLFERIEKLIAMYPTSAR